MRPRRILFVVLSMAALGVLAWVLLRAPPEPVYKGKPLSQWLGGYAPDHRIRINLVGYSMENWDSAAEAMRAIGTNAIPTLFSMLNARDTSLKRSVIALLEKQNYVHFDSTPATNRNFAGAMGFRHLGAAATNAIPELIQIYARNVSSASRSATLMALDDVGPHNLPALARGLAWRKPEVREMVIGVMDRSEVPAEKLLPYFISALNDDSPAVRAAAVRALAHRENAAQPAVPALLKLLQDRDPEVRTVTEYALRRIDPAAAAQAGLK